MWAFVIKYRPGLFNLCKRYARNVDEAHELFSDVVLERLPRILEVSEDWAYVYSRLRGHLFNHYARGRKYATLPLNDELTYEVDQETRLTCISILDTLPPDVRSAMYDHYWQDKSVREIAAERGLTFYAARQLILTGLELMWHGLQEHRP